MYRKASDQKNSALSTRGEKAKVVWDVCGVGMSLGCGFARLLELHAGRGGALTYAALYCMKCMG